MLFWCFSKGLENGLLTVDEIFIRHIYEAEKPYKTIRLCSTHFEGGMFVNTDRTRLNSVPRTVQSIPSLKVLRINRDERLYTQD